MFLQRKKKRSFFLFSSDYNRRRNVETKSIASSPMSRKRVCLSNVSHIGPTKSSR